MRTELEDGVGLAEEQASETAHSSANTPAETGCVFPLSFAQQRLWFLDRFRPGDTAYLIPFSLRLTGPLNPGALEKSLDEIVRRHEILRTTFALEHGEPVQIVRPHTKLPVLLVNLAGFIDPLAEAKRLAAEESDLPIDLERGPTVRARLLRLGAEDHVLLFTMHHIAFDGSSSAVFGRELKTLYEAFSTGKESPLDDPALQYADFTVWQRDQLRGQRLERQLDYWKQTLDGISGSIDLPTDRHRPAVLNANGGSCVIRIDSDLKRELTLLARKHNATLYMTLLAAFQALLSRYAGQTDIVVGSPIAGRNRRELEDLIGLFANTIVLRNSLQGSPSFTELIARSREACLGAFANQDVPFEKLVETLPVDRNLGQNPIFQVIFALQNVPGKVFELRGLRIEPFWSSETAAKFDISLLLRESPDIIQGRIEYHADLFDEPTIERMIGHYLNLLRGIVRTPERPVLELPLLSADEDRFLSEWNRTAQDYPRHLCVHHIFERQCANEPARLALTMGTDSLSYEQLNARANQVAHWLRLQGAGPGTLVGIRMSRGLNMVAGLLGILKSGAAYVPLDPAFPEERIALILEDAAARIVLGDEDWSRFDSMPTENLPVSGQPDDVAYVLHTSGSTGKPKGVEITHRNLVNFLCSMREEPGIDADDTLLAVTTLSFDIAGLEIYLPLLTGAKILIASRDAAMDGNRLLKLLRDRRPTVLQATPATWRMLLEAGWEGSPNLKALCGGEALQPDLAEQLLPRVSELWNMYGPTETTIWSSVFRVRSTPHGAAPLGRPIANTTMYVLDERMQVVPLGVPGELYIGGDGVARGYLNRPDLTAERFVDDPFSPGSRLYRTGDLVKLTASAELQFLGRIDHQVKIRGFRIELGEIEARLSQHPAVAQCVVVTRGHGANDAHLAAYAVLNSSQSLSFNDMRDFIRQRLPDYMVPASLTCLPAFPLTPSGKVDRRRLPQAESRPQLSPRDEALFNAWREELEALLKTHPDVEEFVAAVREVADSGWHLFAWVVKRKGSLLASADLWSRLAPGCATEMPVPVILMVDRLPRKSGGEIDVDSLSAPLQVSVGTGSLRIEPRDALECQLVRIWEEVLGVTPIGISDNYFELGGHSIIAVRLFRRIEEETGRELPLSLLFKAPTVAEFAAAMREQAMESRAETLLVPCRATGSKPPLFTIHGLGGNILAFWDLARHLGSDRPVYCMETLDPGISERSLEEIAARYIRDIRAFRPTGPYHLTGSSFGGMLIFEMARQLRAAGLEVGLVGLLDTYNMVQAARLSSSFKATRTRIRKHLSKLPSKRVSEWPRYLGGRIIAIGRRTEQMAWRRLYWMYLRVAGRKNAAANATEAGAGKPSPFQDLWRVYQAMGLAYKPKAYQGRIVLFRATDPSRNGNYGTKDLGWGSLAAGGLEIIKIPGDHLSMLHEPNIAVLAEQMTRWLSAYEREARSAAASAGD